MPLTTEEKESIVSKFGENKMDTGSAAVQIALLTSRIRELTDHTTKHKRSEEHTSELQSRTNLVCRLLLEKKKKK